MTIMEDILSEEPSLSIKRQHDPLFRKDRHLSSALVTTEIEYMWQNKTNPKGLKREHRELIEDLKDETPLSSQEFIPLMLHNRHDLAYTKRPLTELSTCMHIAANALRVSLVDYLGYADRLPCELTPLLVQCFHIKTSFDELISEITFSNLFKQKWQLGKIEGTAYGNLHLVRVNRRSIIITHSHLVALRDIINSWFSILCYASIYKNKYPGFNFYQEVEQMLLAGENLLWLYKREAYKIFKLWPSLTISCILRDLELRDSFHTTVTGDLEWVKHTQFYKMLTRTMCTNTQAMLSLEISGLWKCFGHPDIDMNSSVATWIKKGSAGKSIDRHTAHLVAWALRLEFCRQYYKDKKRWPLATLETSTPQKVVYCYRNNLWTETADNPWKPEDFQHVILQKNLDFDYHVDIADLLADKSIIPSKEQWIHEYDKQAHRTKYGYFPRGPPPTSKSVIVTYLQKESITVQEVIDQLQKGDIPASWLVMVAVAKEREFKYLDARFFGKMCFEMRLYQTATEKNIAEAIFRYIKHQSMTLNEEQLTRTILRMNAPVSSCSGESYVFITLDFSSWCTNFRYEAATPLFIELDRLFGLHNVYSFTHLFPLMSYLLFQDRFSPPQQGPDGNPLPGPRCYPYPEAWLEGLRQKGWTLLTILVILIASWRCGTSASLLGQGDNQVILLRLPPSEYLTKLKISQTEYIDQFLKVLEELSSKIGIVIKLDETWWSYSLFEYSRKYHLKGAQVSGALKRISRLASEANQVIPSLNSDLSGLFSTGATAAAEDSTPMYAYFCTVLEAALHLRHELPWLRTAPWEKTCCILLLTRTLGGFPITIYSQFCTRAVQDVLSSNLHLVRTALHDAILGKHMRTTVNLDITGKRDFLSLIKDPQSLPLHMPIQPENYVKREVKKGLTDFIVNKDVKELFSLQTDMAQDALVQDLVSITPCNPKLLNKIYALSNIGLQERWLGKFSNTRSIQQTAFSSWSDEASVLLAVKGLETRFSEYLKKKKEDSEVEKLYHAECVTVYTQHLREMAWGIHLEGITMPPQQEQTILKAWDVLSPELARRAILVTEQKTPDLNKAHHRGHHTPYFGSVTKLRARRAPLQVVEVGSMVSSIKQLMELFTWVKGNEALEKLLTKMLEEKTTLSPDTLKKFTRQVYSGSLTHRLPCPALKSSGMSNQNLNHPSHFTITSDTALDYAKGGINYNICFQSAFLHGLSVLAHYTEFNLPHPRQMALIFICNTCTWVIPPENFTLERSIYTGVILPTRITELHQKDVHYNYPLTCQIGEEDSYAVQLARKFAAWIVRRRMIDKITSLENRAIEEVVSVSFVNLAEFSRLQVPLFLKSFIFYCAVFDGTFFARVYDYYTEIIEGGQKNPYDLMLASLRQCGHLRTLCSLHGSRMKASYSSTDLRLLLYFVINKLLDDLPGVLVSAYIVTPEDDLPIVIRAIQVWLTVNEQPDYLSTGMTQEELDKMLTTEYAHCQQILPAITLHEEETIALIRTKPVVSITEKIRKLPNLEIPVPLQTLSNEIHKPYLPFLYLIMNCAVASSLAAVLSECGSAIRYSTLVTLDDLDGLLYSTVSHMMDIDFGFPHWRNNDNPAAEPSAITTDTCNIIWSKEEYYCYAAREIVVIPNRTLVVIPQDQGTLYELPEAWQTLQRVTAPCVLTHVQMICRTAVKGSPTECWVLRSSDADSQDCHVSPCDTARIGENPLTTLSIIRPYLLSSLRQPHCLHPYPHVLSLYGALPTTLADLVLKTRQLIRSQVIEGGRQEDVPRSYERAIGVIRAQARRLRSFKLIAKLHVILFLIRKQQWQATLLRGKVSYHTHRRGRGVLWRACHHGVVVDVGDLAAFSGNNLLFWMRYLWTLFQDADGLPSHLETHGPSFVLS
ncbi:RdRp [Hymenopteran orino-related virus OKIAV85]|uniref:RNA-directed RNA polymerase n=1 Tax=Hymenopteran orino-related virus OKIAV85 TaxID=2789450 RepID=A0A7U3S2Z6_9MONO|nr:RdRp [Hymenopteran orino-related virus OKIAV85]QPB73978.1 RdRp [Hymenopteran orino-related virus OKIAV85]